MTWIILFGMLGPGRLAAAQSVPTPPSPVCALVDESETTQLWDCQPGFATGHDQVSISTSVSTTPITLGKLQRLNPSLKDVIVSFDVGADGSANLVYRQVLTDSGQAIAEFYDDQNDNGYVDYRITGEGALEPLEAGPVVRMLAGDGWFHAPDGRINFNLDIVVDGPLRATFDFRPQDITTPDGSADVEIFVRDVDRDGMPDYEWRQHWLRLPESDGYVRTEIVVNTEDDEHPITNWFLIPFLSTQIEDQTGYYVKRGYDASAPPINVDWTAGRVTHVAEIVTSRHNPGNYFVYSIARAGQGPTPSRANFENPLAFYDLSGNHESIPNLLIRNAHFPVDDRYFPGVPGQRYASNDVTYTWRLPTADPVLAPIWDFKISLVGRDDYEQVQHFPDFDIVTADYPSLPNWVLTRSWDIAAFVAVEGAQFTNDEGIAEWGAILERHAPASYAYVAGAQDQLALDNYRSISPGYRGEYSVDFGREPLVYLSSVDRKLHLLHAAEGIWRVSEEEAIRYWDLDGDGYIDRWLAESWQANGSEPDLPPVRQTEREWLQLLPGYLLWQSKGQIRLREAETEPAVFVAPPPSDTASYQALGAQMESRGDSDPDPGGLSAWLRPFAGPTQTVDRASMAAPRYTPEQGYRFELHLEPGFATSGESLLSLAGLSPGAYLVTLTNGQLAVAPLEPPRLSLTLGRGAHPPATAAPLALPVRAANDGGRDAPGLILLVQAVTPDGGLETLARRSLDALADSSMTAQVTWQPDRPGLWQVGAQLLDETGSVLASAPQTFWVAPGAGQDLPADTAAGRALWLAGLLAGLALCLVAAVALARRAVETP